jgi:predicted ATPase/DNA-binding SARP family transcriptional activator
MMAKLEIFLLGPFQVLLNEASVTAFESLKVRALLAYLAAEADRPQRREALAALLWPDWPQKSAMSNLRYALADLRKVIGDRDAQPPFLLITRDSLQLNQDADLLVDVSEFATRDPQSTILNLQSVISLYRGPFLEGFSLPDSAPFEEWLLAKREYTNQQMLKALNRLAAWSIEQGEYEQAEGYARRQIELETWREPAHQQLMRALSLKGERVQALAQFESLRKALQRELKVAPSEETIQLYASIRDEEVHPAGGKTPKEQEAPSANHQSKISNLQSTIPTPTSLPRHNLPQQLTSFIGREKEIAQVQALLSNTPGRMVTLTGAGGTGKSRLALVVAEKMLNQFAPGDYRFADGVWLAELWHLTDTTQVPRAVATALGLQESGGIPISEVLNDYVRNRRLLLVLDNCEHLLEASAQLVETLLRLSPGLTVLATSREALGVIGEAIYHVPEFAVPNPQSLPPLEEVTHLEAVRLFADRAALVQPDFTVTDQNILAVVEICYRLSGIPLAIELAAARAVALSLEQIAVRLTDRFRLLTGGSRTALPHQQTLRASIDWSFDMLSGVERLLFGRLSVFSGGWTLEAAENICAQDGIETDEVLDILASLVKKSLVVFLSESPRREIQEPRYRMLETIRQYAHEKLLDDGGDEVLRRWHLEYFRVIAEQAETESRGLQQKQWLDRLAIELDNLRQALEWGLADETLEGFQAGLRLVAALSMVRLLVSADEGAEWLDRYQARPQWPQVVPTLLQAKVWNAMGLLRFSQSNWTTSSQAYTQSLTLYSQRKDAQGQLDALCMLFYIADWMTDREKMLGYMEEAFAVAQKAGIYQQARLLMMKGYSMLDPEEAKRYYTECLALCEKEGDSQGAQLVLRQLSIIATEQGDYERSEDYLQKALTISRELNSLIDIMFKD